MDSRIILGTQPVNALAALDAGTQAAGRANNVAQQNAFRGFLRENGAGVMAGNQNALAGLAAFDPQAALGGQQSRLGMDATRQQMRLRDTAEGRAIEQHLLTMDATRQQATRSQIEQGMRRAVGAYMQGDLAGVNAVLTQAGEEPLTSLDQFPAVAALYKEAWDLLGEVQERNAPPEPADEYGRYVQEELAAGRTPLSRIDYAQAKKGVETIYDPATGRPIIQRGGAGADLNELQSKNAVFATRASGALQTLEQEDGDGVLADRMTSQASRLGDALPLNAGRYFQTPEYQVAAAAGQEFLQAILRKDTGAAITEQEQVLYGQLYLPQPGDTPEVLAYRREARRRAVAAIEAGMSPAAMQAKEAALAGSLGVPGFGGGNSGGDSNQGQRRVEASGPQIDFSAMTREDALSADLSAMTPEQRAAWAARMDELGL